MVPDTDLGKMAAIGYCFGGMAVLEMARDGQNLGSPCKISLGKFLRETVCRANRGRATLDGWDNTRSACLARRDGLFIDGSHLNASPASWPSKTYHAW
jgi:hypothetical protein